MKPSEIWDKVVEENPWLFPLMFKFPQCRYCAYSQTVTGNTDGSIVISCNHHPNCRINHADAGPIVLSDFTGPIGIDLQ